MTWGVEMRRAVERIATALIHADERPNRPVTVLGTLDRDVIGVGYTIEITVKPEVPMPGAQEAGR